MKVTGERQETRSQKGFLMPLIWGTVGGLAVSVLVLALLAMIFTSHDMPQASATPLSRVAFGLGALFAGMIAAKRFNRHGLVFGALSGVLFFVVVLLIGLMMRISVSTWSELLKLLAALLCGGIGGVIGINFGQHRRVHRAGHSS